MNSPFQPAPGNKNNNNRSPLQSSNPLTSPINTTIDINSPITTGKKQVRFNEDVVSETILRSPSTTTATASHITSSATHDNVLVSPISKQARYGLTSSSISDNFNPNDLILFPHQYVALVAAKIYHIIFLFAHIILHIFMLTLTCYTSSLAPVEGFTVYLIFSSIIHIISVFVGLGASGNKNNTELLLQVYAVVNGLSIILQAVTFCLFSFGFTHIVHHMKSKYLEELSNGNAVNSFVSLYDLLHMFKGVLIAVHVLDFVGVLTQMVMVKIEISYLYHQRLRWIPITLSKIKYTFTHRNHSIELDEFVKSEHLAYLERMGMKTTQSSSGLEHATRTLETYPPLAPSEAPRAAPVVNEVEMTSPVQKKLH